MEFRLPPLGEGIDSATVVGVLVKPGDAVSEGQNVLAVETDKAAMEVGATSAGTVDTIHVKPGDKLAVGGLVLSMKNGVPAAKPAAPAPQPAAAASPPPAPAPAAASGPVVFNLPPLGEGIDTATVVGVTVKVGDTVAEGQTVLNVETDKAAMDVGSTVAGTVTEISVKTGDKLAVGGKVLTVTGAAKAVEAAAPAPVPAAAKPAAAEPKKEAAPAPAAEAPRQSVKDGALVPAGPATRRLARELGVGLGEVKATGRGGRVTLDDIKGFVKAERQTTKTAGGTAGLSGKTVADSFTTPPLPDFAKYGPVERKAVSGIRQTIARNLTVAWRTMPMVTQNDLCDITDLEAGRKRIADATPKGSPKTTWTVLSVKAVVAVLKEFPTFNASYDMNAGEVVLKKYYHIGIAVDTERGLVVPVIRDADKKSIRDIAAEVAALAEKARTGKLAIDEMRGGTFTITNLGGIGGTSFTPIVNYPEVAILGLSRSALQPVVKDGAIVPRLMMPLSLTYDHRVIDGADGARFTTRLSQLFSDPIRLLMES